MFDESVNRTDAFVLDEVEPDKNIVVDFNKKNGTENGTEAEAGSKKKGVEPTTVTVTFGGASEEQNVQMITKLVESPEDMEEFKKQQGEVEEEGDETEQAEKKGYRIVEVDDDSLIDIYPKNRKVV